MAGTGDHARNESVVVRFEDVNLDYGDTQALLHLSFEMRAGETRVLLGAAGSGKTQLLKCTVGLVRPDSGHIYLFGEDVTKMKESELYGLRAKVGILFQEGGLFDSQSVAENVAYPLENQASRFRNGSGPVDPEDLERRVRDSLRFVELEHTLEKFPSELSGGMRRRVGIARAVVAEPALVLYDSPTAGLDPITANTIISLIIKERDLRDTATIMVTHRFQDGHMVANFRYNPSSGQIELDARSQQTTTFMVMKEGQLVFEGSEDELRASDDPYIQKFARPGSS
jgi:phospholipid/cholesterol/gamma-HCH transport system ATP-binding protein